MSAATWWTAVAVPCSHSSHHRLREFDMTTLVLAEAAVITLCSQTLLYVMIFCGE